MNYFVTGSRAYGPVQEDSDIDLVMLVKDSNVLYDIVESLGLATVVAENQDSTYADKVWYFTVGDIFINIVAMKSQTDYDCWKEVTRRMVALPEIIDKEERIKTFKGLFNDVWNAYPDSIRKDDSPPEQFAITVCNFRFYNRFS